MSTVGAIVAARRDRLQCIHEATVAVIVVAIAAIAIVAACIRPIGLMHLYRRIYCKIRMAPLNFC